MVDQNILSDSVIRWLANFKKFNHWRILKYRLLNENPKGATIIVALSGHNNRVIMIKFN